MDKKALRKEMKSRVATMGEEERRLFSECLFARLESLPEFLRAECILVYWSLPDEPCSHAFLSKWNGRKSILLPSVVGDDLQLRNYEGDESMETGAFGIKEPAGPVFTDYAKVGMVIVPGLAFDAFGYRLGRGKGYYDRLLPRLASATTVGVCFPCQYEPQLPHDEWDVPLDKVVCQI